MITLYGHGYIGNAIARELRFNNVSFRWLSHSHPNPPPYDGDLIINAAGFVGFSNVDDCEKHKVATILGNIVWPLSLAHLRHLDYPARIIHISSGCLYSGNNNGNGWKETDFPNFYGSMYSLVKIAEEQALLPFLQSSYILRIRMPFSGYVHPRNLLDKLYRYEKIVDAENSLTRVEDLAKVVVKFALETPPFGVYNVCNPGSITNKEIVEIMGWNKEIITQEEFKKLVTAERSFCVLNTEKLEKIISLPDVRKSLYECSLSFRR